MGNNKIIVFDTTLRDGEQSLQARLTIREKLQIAKALERLGVDVIEAGFPVSSPGDLEAVQAVAREIKNSRVCGLARAVKPDIDACHEALKVADQFRIHTFISTSTIHVQDKLKKGWEDVVQMAIDAVTYARNFTDDVEFSCEDAGRTPRDRLCQIVEAAISAGASTVNIPDTVGYTIPSEFASIMEDVFNRVPNIDKAVISVHCHDDLGLSVANTVAALEKGARQVEGTINGLGERAGNASLEELIMLIKTRKDYLGLETDIKTEEISRTSKLVSQICNVPIQPNKAIVGSNAFSHSSGIHQDGVLKNKRTYEIMTPESVGLSTNELNLTSRSGRHVIKHMLEGFGYTEEDFNLDEVYKEFLSLADKKGKVYDYDLESLVILGSAEHKESYHLEYLNVSSGTGTIASATVVVTKDGKEYQEAATGNGPVDSAYSAIDRITGIHFDLKDYRLSSKSLGRNALGQVDIVVEKDNRTFHGMGISEDIVEASVRAYLNVINTVLTAQRVREKREAIASV
jgi:2-isopropylmalate synthase